MAYKQMSATEFRAALEELQLTQSEAAKFLGVSARSISGYASVRAHMPVPKSIALLLRVMRAQGLWPGKL